MKKILSFMAVMLLWAVTANADTDPVALPATLDVSNVNSRSDGMPNFVIQEGQDYAGTYFDMGPNSYSTDTLLCAEWNVTIEPMKYDIDVFVYNTNSWRIQLYLLNQAGDTVKSLRYKGSSGDKGQFAIGSMDMRDLAAGDYKVIAHAATAYSAMKLRDVIFTVDYKGVSVELPGSLQPAYALLSANASVTNGAIAFKPSTAPSEYATWNVSFAEAGNYNVSIDMTATNGHNYGVALFSADGQTQINAVSEGSQKSDTGEKDLGTIAVPTAGNYVVKLTNSIQYSEAVLNSITFTTNYKGVSVDLPGTLQPAYALLSANASVTNGAIAFKPSTADQENATWNVSFAEAGCYRVTVDMTATNCHSYSVALLSVDGETQIGVVSEGDGCHETTGDIEKVLGTIIVPAAGNYMVKLTNATQWSEAVMNSITFTAITYTVAGNSETLFGTSWDPTNTNNDMVMNDGIYTFTKNVNLTAGTILFKVVEDHAWTVAYPASDYQLSTVLDDGNYDVTITFDPSTSTVSATAVAEPRTLYLKPGVWYWDNNQEKFAVYAYRDGLPEYWSDFMTLVEGHSHTYMTTIPSNYAKVVFVRFGNVSTVPSWTDNMWNQTYDITLEDDKDLLTIGGLGEDESGKYWGTWSVFADAPAELVNGYYLIGRIGGVNGWSVTDLTSERLLTVNPDNDEEYKVAATLATDAEYPDELQIVGVHCDAITDWYPGGNGKNYIVDVNHDGEMVIYFRPDYSGGEDWHHNCIYVAVAPYIRENVTEGQWGTLCLPFNATLDNAQAYYIANAADITNSTITVTEKEGSLEAGKAYLVKALADGNIVANMSGDKATTPVEVNGLIGNLAAEAAHLAVDASYDYYILSAGQFHQLTGTATADVAQYKGYLRIAKEAGAPSMLRIVEAENNTTDVKSVEANEKAVKFFENGQLRILRDGVIYDATGRVVR